MQKAVCALLMLGATLAAPAWAQQDQPCAISVSGGGLVGLGQADVFDFPTVGSTQNWTPFSIELTACDLTVVEPGKVGWVYFSGLNANATTGMLDNAGTATGIALQLTDGSGNPFAVAADPNTPVGSTAPVVLEDGGQSSGNHLTYGVQFYRFSAQAPGVGIVSASVQFVFNFY